MLYKLYSHVGLLWHAITEQDWRRRTLRPGANSCHTLNEYAPPERNTYPQRHRFTGGSLLMEVMCISQEDSFKTCADVIPQDELPTAKTTMAAIV